MHGKCSTDDSFSFIASQDKSACFCTRHSVLIKDIKNLKPNEHKLTVEFLKELPTLEVEFTVVKEPGIEKVLEIVIRQKERINEKPRLVFVEIINHSSNLQGVLREKRALIGGSAQYLHFSYATIMERSKHNHFLDKNGEMLLQFTLHNDTFDVSRRSLASLLKKFPFRKTIFFFVMLFVICLCFFSLNWRTMF